MSRAGKRMPRLIAGMVALAALWLAPAGAQAEDVDLTGIPTGKGLPVVVRAGVFFDRIEAMDETEQSFEATTDLRLTWQDPRLSYPAGEALHGYKEYPAGASEAEIAKIWTPNVRITNLAGDPSFQVRRLRVYPDGQVETMTRTTASFKAAMDVSHFPFDHQFLTVALKVEETPVESVDLDFSSQDVAFSRVAPNARMDGWDIGFVNLKRGTERGWDGDRFATLSAAAEVARQPGGSIATIFIPLFASLLIPFFATWMNRVEDGAFAVDAFELANVIIGGLFAVIALSFTVSSSYPVLAAGDNTVTRLIGLNYIALCVGLIITVALYRYNVARVWFGAYVQEQLFVFLMWAFPAIFVLTGIAFVAAAWA